MYFYDLETDDMKALLDESPYNPESPDKSTRKLKTLVDWLNRKGYEVNREDIEVFPQKGLFGTNWCVRVYNPHYDGTEDDDVYFSFKWI